MAQIGKKYNRHEVLNHAERKEEQEAAASARLQDHHIMSESRNTPVPLFDFVKANARDPAIIVSTSLQIFKRSTYPKYC